MTSSLTARQQDEYKKLERAIIEAKELGNKYFSAGAKAAQFIEKISTIAAKKPKTRTEALDLAIEYYENALEVLQKKHEDQQVRDALEQAHAHVLQSNIAAAMLKNAVRQRWTITFDFSSDQPTMSKWKSYIENDVVLHATESINALGNDSHEQYTKDNAKPSWHKGHFRRAQAYESLSQYGDAIKELCMMSVRAKADSALSAKEKRSVAQIFKERFDHCSLMIQTDDEFLESGWDNKLFQSDDDIRSRLETLRSLNPNQAKMFRKIETPAQCIQKIKDQCKATKNAPTILLLLRKCYVLLQRQYLFATSDLVDVDGSIEQQLYSLTAHEDQRSIMYGFKDQHVLTDYILHVPLISHKVEDLDLDDEEERHDAEKTSTRGDQSAAIMAQFVVRMLCYLTKGCDQPFSSVAWTRLAELARCRKTMASIGRVYADIVVHYLPGNKDKDEDYCHGCVEGCIRKGGIAIATVLASAPFLNTDATRTIKWLLDSRMYSSLAEQISESDKTALIENILFPRITEWKSDSKDWTRRLLLLASHTSGYLPKWGSPKEASAKISGFSLFFHDVCSYTKDRMYRVMGYPRRDFTDLKGAMESCIKLWGNSKLEEREAYEYEALTEFQKQNTKISKPKQSRDWYLKCRQRKEVEDALKKRSEERAKSKLGVECQTCHKKKTKSDHYVACGGCECYVYCSEAHAQKHWEEGHYDVCAQIREKVDGLMELAPAGTKRRALFEALVQENK